MLTFSVANASVNAKVVLLRGSVMVLRNGQAKYLPLRQGDQVQENSKIKTLSKSFVRIQQDTNTISLGPESEMLISRFPKSSAGAISLLKGQIRSQINKENNQEKVKLVVKTPSAAMGVRGTEFQVIYNPVQAITTLVTFSGQVDMTPHQGPLKLNNLNKVFDPQKTVSVTQGKFSGTIPGKSVVSLPVKISPVQFNGLKRNKDLNSNETPSADSKKETSTSESTKTYRSPIPSKAMAKLFVNNNSELTSEVRSKFGAQKISEYKQTISFSDIKVKVPPEGMNDPGHNMFAPPAGGLLDTKTGLYVPPPPGSHYDANTEVYVPSKDMGSVDYSTGDYIPPAGMELKADGNFVAKNGADTQSMTGRPHIMQVSEYGDSFMKAQISSDEMTGEAQFEKKIQLSKLSDEEIQKIEDKLDRIMDNNNTQNNLLKKSQVKMRVHLAN